MQPGLDEPIRHPGQVIQNAQQGMIEAGLARSNWKFATKLPSSIMQEVIKHRESYSPAAAINHMAVAQAIPTPAIANRAIAMLPIRFNIRLEGPPGEREAAGREVMPLDEMEDENYGRVLRLMFRESQQNPQDDERIIRESRDLTDYIRGMCEDRNRIESTNWSGMLRRSVQWHRHAQEREEHRRRQQLIDKDNGYLEWNTLLEDMEIDGMRVTPSAASWTSWARPRR